MATGTYARTEIADADDGVEIYGGYMTGTWARTRAAATTISGSPYGLSLTNALDVVVQFVTVTSTADAAKSAYGIRTTGSELALIEPNVTAGRGTDGVSALMAADGVDGADGADGFTGQPRDRQLRHPRRRRVQRQAGHRHAHRGARRQRRHGWRGDQRRRERHQRQASA